MEEITSFAHQKPNYEVAYHGKGSDYFGIIIVNWLLCVITLGFYYPWAKAKTLQYLYGETSLNGDRFSFHGTGAEMFKGFIKAILIFVALYALLFFFIFLEMPIVGILVFYLGFMALLPIAIHGSYRYRMSRTSWRGIRFGYRGNRTEFIGLFFKWIMLTIVTLGIYASWMTINLRQYLLSNVRFGDAKFEYEGDGWDYFLLNLKGYILTLFTLGIYMFWWQKDLIAYYVDNLTLNKDGKKIEFTSKVSAGGVFGLTVVNLLIIIFTLGIGYAWVVTRTLTFLFDHIEMEGDIVLDTLSQTEENFKDATGEDVGDMLDIDFVF